MKYFCSIDTLQGLNSFHHNLYFPLHPCRWGVSGLFALFLRISSSEDQKYSSLHRSAPASGAPATEGGAPQQPPNLTSNRRLQQTQAQVDEVSTAITHLRPELFIRRHSHQN